ncbi:MAG: hypothetical protein HYX41_05955 [Bdellovibrio sp.]|nr:hypothetical protein [Bdellovibrio sp.]
MQVKKFEASTIQEALDDVKKELGPEAIILQTKKSRKGLGFLSKATVEVTAAVSERSIQKKQYVENRVPDQSKDLLKKLPAKKQADLLEKYVDQRLTQASETQDRVDVSGRSKKSTATRYADISDNHEVKATEVERKRESVSQKVLSEKALSEAISKTLSQSQGTPAPAQTALEEEIRVLRQIVQELKNSQEKAETSGANRIWDSGTLDHPVLQESFEKLVVNGVDRRYAYGLVKKVAFDLGTERCAKPEVLAEALAAEMMDSIEVTSLMKFKPASGPLVLAVVGPTGVGKTATVAKIAGQARSRKKLRVGLIHFDTSPAQEFGHLSTYAKALNLPFRYARTLDDFRAATMDFKSLDLVLVDTPGRSYLDHASLSELQKVLTGVPDLITTLILSAGGRDPEHLDCINRFSIFKPQSLIFSKLDETRIYGGIYNAFQKSKLPLLFFTTGQKVPEDLEEASTERVVSLVLRI